MIKRFIHLPLYFILLLALPIKGQAFHMLNISDTVNANNAHPKAASIQAVLDQLVQQSIPGAVASIYDTQGSWTGSAGYASLESGLSMQSTHLQYLQSIAKTYMAVVILKLYEEGSIDLDEKAGKYLPEEQSKLVPGLEKVTVRMLLNHTSGLPEYNFDPTYITRLLQNPTRLFEPAEYLEYVKNMKPMFEAGSRYSYVNLNYVLLALIADQVTGNHAVYMKEKIFEPLGLKHTFYRIAQGNTYGGMLVNSYWDRHSNGTIENISVLQNSNVASMAGDDGLITTPEEAVLFLKGLMEGKLLKPETFAMMQQWVKDSKGKARYGLGLSVTNMAGEQAIGHSGGGLGSGCELYYFPAKQVYMFLSINLGTVTTSPIHKHAEKLLEELHQSIVH